VDWLQAKFEIITLVEAQRRITQGFNPRPSVCVTFDDGYADNLSQALPLLLERRIPFTYFVAWDFIREQLPFPHDVQRGQPLAVNTAESIRALADLGVEIGSHTGSHCDLGPMEDPQALRRELVDSKRAIEDFIGHPVRYFAFPYGQRGNLSAAAFSLGRAAGYWGMCSAYGGYNLIGEDAFHLQRFHGDPNLEYLKTWLDFDPRMARIRRFDTRAVRDRSRAAIPRLPMQPAASTAGAIQGSPAASSRASRGRTID
jgi:peptidoglycan/xylan/chitin deacetylase (PgdA/CDA1 family)